MLESGSHIKVVATAVNGEVGVIGCSTGGPPALQHLFQELPLLPVPFVVAQHMPPTFTRLFADRVNRLTPYNVREAVDGEPLLPGNVYVAPGGMQTEVRRNAEGLHVRCAGVRSRPTNEESRAEKLLERFNKGKEFTEE